MDAFLLTEKSSQPNRRYSYATFLIRLSLAQIGGLAVDAFQSGLMLQQVRLLSLLGLK